MCEKSTVNCVIEGSLPPNSLKTFSKTGTRKVTSASRTVIAKTEIMIGYIIAAFTWRRRESSDRKSTRLNSSHSQISYAVFCLKQKQALREHALINPGTKQYHSVKHAARSDHHISYYRRLIHLPRHAVFRSCLCLN